MRLDLVPHQTVYYGNQECIVRDMEDYAVLLENEEGGSQWVDLEEIGNQNPDLILEDGEGFWDEEDEEEDY